MCRLFWRQGVPPLANEICLLRGVDRRSRAGLIYGTWSVHAICIAYVRNPLCQRFVVLSIHRCPHVATRVLCSL